MNILDENILEDQREILKKWNIPFRQIGYEISRTGIQDEEIIPLLLRLPQATLFTVDYHFFKRKLCHAKYGLVFLDVDQTEAALYVRRVLRHPEFDTRAKRMGIVIRAYPTGLSFWRLRAQSLESVNWSRAS